AGAIGASVTAVAGSGDTYLVTVSTGSDGALGLNLPDDDSIRDAPGNPLGGAGTANGDFAGEAYTIDRTAPTVLAVTRLDIGLTNAAIVRFAVTFSESVTGVGAANFTVSTADLSGAAVTGVSGSGDTWTVTASTGSGDGALRLDV